MFRGAIDLVLEGCQVKRSFALELAPEETEDTDFLQEFERSTRIVRLEISYPTADNVPDDFVYYNPQIERNRIIRDSHRHDYPHLKKINLEALEGGDLKQTHFRDLIYAGQPQNMNYYVGMDEFTLRRDVKRKFEFYIDMEAEQVPEDHLLSVIEMLRRERAIYIDTPTPEAISDDQGDNQLSFLSDL